MKLFSVVTLLASLAARVVARSSTGDSVLVVLEKGLNKEDYSIFFGNLERRGYQLTFRQPNETTPEVIKYDVPQFSHIIFFAPTTKTPAKDLLPQNLIDLMTSDPSTNLLVALGPSASAASTFAAEFGLSLPPPNTPLISHFPPRKTPHSIVNIPVPDYQHPLLTPKISPVVFEGIGYGLSDNPLLFPILNAPAESFCADSTNDKGADVIVEAAEKGGEGLWAGSKLAVVSGFQTKNGARALFAGGVKMFSNEFADTEVSYVATL
ncbi:oligosaccharyl transferase glycoprotein complex, beta subunit [Tulasnella sp. 418]|nr:oligosaccharyl transferase glycoprotein complex, beta subunit [Tulasnella sp. 418]